MNSGSKRPVRRPSLKVVVPVILFCTYYPYSWLILSKGSWTGYRWTWIKMWPALPGLMPRAMLFHHIPDALALAGMLAITVILVGLLIYLASRRNWLFAVVAPLTFILSALNSMVAYSLYRM
ncbi:hypothetical protein Pan241w_44130 [Gimesia alba]|uniref:Uncharacterized protein n=1 Tax=Gimesia alba TaxID=2527973 RepID=A0A517RKB6_9PLAN|nr:hypothetical protein [Gimesia alba]QDT44304.1 hypothetical protein Pan241w_44130 [Gimesia alba]